ncbi:hypothetical protein OG242_07805 [Streptomyces sp. NBC_00727]|uniref:hypothetical protein n=1 Tax=Streptomyces sp. NBC_00727 TaxID=2903675 RepID=UPI00386EBD3A
MAHTFKFRFRGPAGGLALDLGAEAVPAEGGTPAHSMRIHENVRLGLPASGVHWKDAAWLAFGVSLNAPALSALRPDGVFIRVTSLDHPLSDYRSEAAALAMDGWIRERFALAGSGASVTYDTAEDRYVFAWGTAFQPFSDDPRPKAPPPFRDHQELDVTVTGVASVGSRVDVDGGGTGFIDQVKHPSWWDEDAAPPRPGDRLRVVVLDASRDEPRFSALRKDIDIARRLRALRDEA